MELDLGYIYGQTPLDEEEKDGLLIPAIATRGELDEFEQQNIEEAIQWLLMRNFKAEKIFTEAFVRNVHKRMYGNVWAWAGDFPSNLPSRRDCRAVQTPHRQHPLLPQWKRQA
jgi:fido (protein-threonine AMPylation protein)